MSAASAYALDRCLRTVIAVAAFPLTLIQHVQHMKSMRRIDPPGRVLNMGGRPMHAIVSGKGSPNVILESGMGGCALDWAPAQSGIARYATVVSYDRAGFGWSAERPDPPTCRSRVEELRRLLNQLGVNPPYVLVGHSYGGLMMRLFAAEYPDEVSGLILVDCAHERRYLPECMDDSRTRQWRRTKKLYRIGYWLAATGLPRLFRKHAGSNALSSTVREAVRTVGAKPSAFRTLYRELLCAEQSARQLQAAPSLRQDLAVSVICAGKQPEQWKQDQRRLRQLTERVTYIEVENCGHAIHQCRPDIIINEVQKLSPWKPADEE